MKPRSRSVSPAFLITLLLLVLPTFAQAGEGKVRKSPGAVRGEYIVVLNDDTPRDQVPGVAHRLARESGGDLKKVWQDALKGFFIRMTEGQARGLSHHPDVKYIEENGEMQLSTTVPTNIDPACDPSAGNPCTLTDNRLWHLDQMDQGSSLGNNEYSYCETGSGVTVYVIDTGVMRSHREFGNSSAKVADGFDASGDPSAYPAWNPCGGPAPFTQGPDGQVAPAKIRGNGSHGTGVASLINGSHLGVARDAKVVPIKVRPCGRDALRKLSKDTPNTYYATGELVRANSNVYRVQTGGYTGTSSTYPGQNWPWDGTPACCQYWGDIALEYVGWSFLPDPDVMTVQMTIDGLNWILSPANPNPKTRAVVSLSTYRVAGVAGVSTPPPGYTTSLEDAIGNLLTYNTHGITVVASANNQDANACDTSPGRMSRNNPNNPNSSTKPYKVITAGGTMLRNNPDPNPATGGTGSSTSPVNAPEPLYDPTKATRLARWRCHAGDSDICSGNLYANPPYAAPDPATDPVGYSNKTLGSNGGQCVTLFAPAKNIPVANLDSTASYRNSRANAGTASGTSWSAPIVAGMAARILQGTTGYTIDDVYNALMARTAADLDPNELDPPNVSGTPNKVLRMTPVVVQPLATTTPLASNGSATINVSASGATPLSYQLYQVNATFDVATYNKGAFSSTPIGSPNANGSFTVSPTAPTSYFVRVSSSCGTADTNITTVASVDPPTGVVATASGGTVTIQWNQVTNAGGYLVERKIGTGAWAPAQTVSSGSTTFVTEAPTVPAGVVLYRVRTTQGSAQSEPSAADVAYTLTFTDDPILSFAPFTTVKAVHIIEVRQAVNALLELAGQGPVYSGNDLDAVYLRTQFIDDVHFTSLMSNLNSARALSGLGSVGFVNPPAAGGYIDDTQMANLRDGVK